MSIGQSKCFPSGMMGLLEKLPHPKRRFVTKGERLGRNRNVLERGPCVVVAFHTSVLKPAVQTYNLDVTAEVVGMGRTHG